MGKKYFQKAQRLNNCAQVTSSVMFVHNTSQRFDKEDI